MSEPSERRSIFFQLRAVLGFVLLALLATHRLVISPGLWILGIAFLLSNLVILALPVSRFRNPVAAYFLFSLDVAILTVFLFAVSGLRAESLLLYYLTIFMATLGGDLRKSIVIAVVAGTIQIVFQVSQGASALWNPETFMQFPLFFVTAISTGYLAQEVAVHRQRIRNLKNIRETLESGIEISSETLARSESARLAAQDLAQRFHDLVQGLDAIIWEADAPTLLFAFVSERAEEILGYAATQWVTVPNFWADHIHPEDRERTVTNLRAALFAGTDHEDEYRMVAADGRVVWFRSIARVIRDAAGSALRVRGVMLDITKQKLAEERDLLFTLSLDMMCIVGFDLYFKRLNPAWERTLGYTREELMAAPVLDFIHPDDREATLAEAQKLSKGEVLLSFENRYRAKDGSYKWLLWTAAPLVERKLIYGIARDNTERRRTEDEIKKLNDELEQRVAERTSQLENAYNILQIEVAERKQVVEALRESETRYRAFFEGNPQPMWVYDVETLSFLAVNDAAIRLYGYSRDEFLTMNIKELRPPEDVPLLLNFISHMLPDRDAATVWRHQKKDGTIIDVETTMHPVAFGGRRAELVSATDVTERKRMVDALRESEYSLAEAQRIAHLGNWNWNIFTNELRWSREIFRIFGVREESFAGTVEGFLSLVHPEDRKLVQDSVDEALTQDKAYSLTHRIVRPDGTHRYVHEQAEVFFDSSHKPARMVGTVQDVTEQRSLEAQFQQSQKMEAIGQLAGGVAHDFNNLLTIISGYSQLLVEETQSGNPANGHAREILKAADRAATLTRQLLTFSRRQVLSTQVLDLNVVLGNVDKMLRRLIGEDIDLLTHLEASLGKVRADPGQVEQIIMNLAVNARDAMPKGGKLTLETANVDLDQAYSHIHFPVKPGPYVMLAVTDTGVGMDATTQAHMFEPFFTTKGQGKGTGLGLATVYGIVKQSSGNIWVYSEVGRGTVFKVYIPRVDDALTQAETPKGAAVARRATETILVVEDEVAVRSLVRGVLSSCGYTVLEASQGDEALTLCDQHKGEIHLVVTDVVMPQMSGRELVARLATMHPSIKVLFMSGYTNEGIVHHGALEKGKAFLQKPFTPAALLTKIRDVLEAVSPAPTPEP